MSNVLFSSIAMGYITMLNYISKKYIEKIITITQSQDNKQWKRKSEYVSSKTNHFQTLQILSDPVLRCSLHGKNIF